ncbi:MAG: hypothetical protein ACXWIN_04685, partial [Burkholderiaceae bacterium]
KNTDTVPDEIVLSMTSQDTSTTAQSISIDFRATAAYHSTQYKKINMGDKLRVAGAKTGIFGKNVLMSLGGLPAQAFAQINLKKTRAAFDEAAKLDHEVRTTLAAAVPNAVPIPSMPKAQSAQSDMSEVYDPFLQELKAYGITVEDVITLINYQTKYENGADISTAANLRETLPPVARQPVSQEPLSDIDTFKKFIDSAFM